MEWTLIPGLAPYEATLRAMEDRVAAISAGNAPEAVWLLEHPPLYTAGTSAQSGDLTDPARFLVHVAGRAQCPGPPGASWSTGAEAAGSIVAGRPSRESSLTRGAARAITLPPRITASRVARSRIASIRSRA